MPKIIENLESRLLEEAEKQIRELEYSAMTIRSVANTCGVGVGTVYNYYPSKDALLASYMMQDWNRCVETIQTESICCDSPYSMVRSIYDQLIRFAHTHSKLFQDKAALASFGASFDCYHDLTRSQLAQPLRKFCDSNFAAEFVAEALLTWTMAKRSFDEIYGVIERLLNTPQA